MLVILENLGKTGSVSKEFMLSREQFYLDLLFSRSGKYYPLLNLNQSPTAGNKLGYKHTHEFRINRSVVLNPMNGKQFSSPAGEFMHMQKRDKTGVNNPLLEKKKINYYAF